LATAKQQEVETPRPNGGLKQSFAFVAIRYRDLNQVRRRYGSISRFSH
jgi:hypothetical protein